MEAVEELVNVISTKEFLDREGVNLGKLPTINVFDKPADLWNFYEVKQTNSAVKRNRREGYMMLVLGGNVDKGFFGRLHFFPALFPFSILF